MAVESIADALQPQLLGGKDTPVLGLDPVSKPPTRQHVDMIAAGVAADALSDSAAVENVRDLLLLQQAANDGMHMSRLLDTRGLQKALEAAADGASHGTTGVVGKTQRAHKETDTPVHWLHNGAEVAMQIRTLASAGDDWTRVAALIGGLHSTCLTHETLAAYHHIYPLSHVSVSAPPLVVVSVMLAA